MSAQLPGEFEGLAADYLDGRSTPEKVERLSAILRENTAARERYLRMAAVHSTLATEDWLWTEQAASTASTAAPRGFSWRMWTALGMAAALVVAMVSVSHRSPLPSNPPVALGTLLFSQDCVWRMPNPPREGERLGAGVLKLQSGTALVRLDSGAEIALRGQTEITLERQGEIRLLRGDIVVRDTQELAGLSLHTPPLTVTDVAPEFAVRVEPDGTTDLHVLVGSLSYVTTTGVDQTARTIAEGEAERVSHTAGQRSIPLKSERFAAVVNAARPGPRADLMTAYEGFYYPPGPLSLADGTRGKGWLGPWRLRNAEERQSPSEEPSTPVLNIVHGQMNVTWPVPGGRLGMLELPAGATYLVRELALPLVLNEDRITYLSFMVRDPAMPGPNLGAGRGDNIRLTFRASHDYFGEHVSFGIHGQRAQILTAAGVGFFSPLLVPTDQTTLWVGKIVSRRNGEDEVHFRVYGEAESLDYAEPQAWHVVTRGLDLRARLDLVLISSNRDAPRIVDELRIGPTWRSVAPMSALITAAR